jgi:hypothetical protein
MNKDKAIYYVRRFGSYLDATNVICDRRILTLPILDLILEHERT